MSMSSSHSFNFQQVCFSWQLIIQLQQTQANKNQTSLNEQVKKHKLLV